VHRTRTLLSGAVVILIAVAIFNKPLMAGAVGVESSWDNLKSLAPGQRIRVVLNSAKSAEGNLETVTAEALSVKQASGVESYARQDILRVSTRGEKHRSRNALLGAAGGAAVGLAIGAGVDHGCSGSGLSSCIVPNAGKIVLTPVGAVVGAVAGALIPTGGWHDMYRAR